MDINQPWHISQEEVSGQFRAAQIAADDGARYSMDANRAKRLVALWNANIGIATEDIEALAAPKVELMEIPQSSDLDPITVFWQNFKPGQGSITITCYGDSWTAWFGAMGDRTIQQFVSECGADYLSNKLSPTHVRLNQTQTRRQDEYLKRIIRAIQGRLNEN